jgi:hypothetical protein
MFPKMSDSKATLNNEIRVRDKRWLIPAFVGLVWTIADINYSLTNAFPSFFLVGVWLATTCFGMVVGVYSIFRFLIGDKNFHDKKYNWMSRRSDK